MSVVRRRVPVVMAVAAVAAALGCASGTAPELPPAAPPGDAPDLAWKQIMGEVVGPTFEAIQDEAALTDLEIDLAAVALGARRTAAAIDRGAALVGDRPWYGEHGPRTSKWLLAIVDAARSDDRDRTRRLIGLAEEHCDACHAASSK